MRDLSDAVRSVWQRVEATSALLFHLRLVEDGHSWFYTSHPKPIVFNGTTYMPEAIKFGSDKDKQDGAGSVEPFFLECGVIEPFVTYMARNINRTCRVTVYEALWGGAEWLGMVVADGFVMGHVVRPGNIRVECVGFGLWLKKNLPSVLFSRFDQNIPYSPEFGASMENSRLEDCPVEAIYKNLVFSFRAAYKPTETGPVLLQPFDVSDANSVRVAFRCLYETDIVMRENRIDFYPRTSWRGANVDYVGALEINNVPQTLTWVQHGNAPRHSEVLTFSPSMSPNTEYTNYIEALLATNKFRLVRSATAANNYTAAFRVSAGDYVLNLGWYVATASNTYFTDYEFYRNGFIEYSRNVVGTDGVGREILFRVPILRNVINPINQSLSHFVLAYEPPYLEVGETFSAYAGYDGTPAVNIYRFGVFYPTSQRIGFLGFPYQPVHNFSINLSALECKQ